MKYVLVIDIADDVAETYEDFTVDYDLRGTPKKDRTVNESIKCVEDADVRPLPQKLKIDKTLNFYGYENFIQGTLAMGFNACLDAITGETK